MSPYNDTLEISTANNRADDLDIPFDLRRGACGKVFHPLALMIPPMTAAEFQKLGESIRTNGLNDPITVHEGKILDGRHRALACEIAKVEPVYSVLPIGADPLQFALDKNLHRRHLNESQRAMIATKIANMVVGGKETNSANLQDCPPISRATAAEMLNVSERTVASAAKVLAAGAPELVQAAERGEVKVSAAAEIVELPDADQVDLVAKGGKEVVKAAAIIRAERKKKDGPRTTSRKQQRQLWIDRAKGLADELATANPKLARNFYDILYHDDHLVLHSLCLALGRKLGLEDDGDADSDSTPPGSARDTGGVSS